MLATAVELVSVLVLPDVFWLLSRGSIAGILPPVSLALLQRAVAVVDGMPFED